MLLESDCLDCPEFENGIFAGLSEAERREALCAMQKTFYPKKQLLFEEGGIANRVHIVRSGLVKLFKHNACKRPQILNSLGPGELFGIEALFKSSHRSSAVTIIKSEICSTSGIDFNDLLEARPSVSIRVIDLMHQDISRTHTFLCNLGTKKAFSRVASSLLFFRDKQIQDEHSLSFYLPVMRHELSELLGVSPETVSRQLRRLVDERVILLENKRVTIIDLRKLSGIAANA